MSARKPKSKRCGAPASEQSGVHSKPSEGFTADEAGTAPSIKSEPAAAPVATAPQYLEPAMSTVGARHLRTLLQFGLWHDQEQPGIRLENTTMHFAAATLKAVAFALAAHNEKIILDGPSWCMDHEFNADDAVVAIGGVAAILDQAKDLIYEVDKSARERGEE